MRAFAPPFLLSLLVLVGCGSSPPFQIFRGQPDERIEPIKGDMLRLSHPSQEAFGGAKPGYHIVHSADEWKVLFPSGEVPGIPTEVNFNQKMIILAVGEGRKTTGVRVMRVLDTANALHIYARETIEGLNCKNETEGNAYHAVITDRLDKNVQVHVEIETGKSCGSAPTARVTCRQGNAATWAQKIAAQPGEMAECEGVPEVTGAYAIVDQGWHFGSIPAGSATKLTFSKNNTHVSFPVDGFGAYIVKFDVTDEAGRKGSGEGVVEVLPPRNNDTYVQLAWAGFDSTDDTSTFPRVMLRVTEHDKPNARVCSKDASTKPDFCVLREQSPSLLMHLKGARDKYVVALSYLDERAVGGPYVCLRTFLNGVQVTNACDKTPPRPADAVWTLGLLDARTATIGPVPEPPPPPPAAPEPPKDPRKPVPKKPVPKAPAPKAPPPKK